MNALLLAVMLCPITIMIAMKFYGYRVNMLSIVIMIAITAVLVAGPLSEIDSALNLTTVWYQYQSVPFTQTDHSALSNLSNDGHQQYINQSNKSDYLNNAEFKKEFLEWKSK